MLKVESSQGLGFDRTRTTKKKRRNATDAAARDAGVPHVPTKVLYNVCVTARWNSRTTNNERGVKSYLLYSNNVKY